MNASRRRVAALLPWVLLAGLPCAARASTYVDFFRAVNVDNASGVRAALQKGLDVNSRNEQGQHALYLALREDCPAVIELLLSWPGIDLDPVNAVGETPLLMAALKGQTGVMTQLLDRGVPVNRPGWSALHYAATGRAVEPVALLLKRGAEVDARSANGSTPLMMAARYSLEPTVRLLVQHGADLNLRNNLGLGVEDFARNADRDWMLDLLARLKAQRR